MKKKLLLSAVSVMLLAACSAEQQTTSTDGNQSSGSEIKKSASQKEAKVELVQESFGAWKNSINTVWVSYSAEIKNTGTAPADLGDLQVNFEGADGNVLGTASMVITVPDVLMPGETAYISESTTLDGITDPNLLTKAYTNIDFSTSDNKPYYLTAENVLLKDNTQLFSESSPYIVTGSIINKGDKKADDIRIAAGLYDESGKLVGVLKDSLSISLNPEGKTAFELSYPDLPPTVKGTAKTVKVVVYNWSMEF